MKFAFAASILFAITAFVHGAEPAGKNASKLELKSVRDKASYIIGLQIGHDFKRKSANVDLDLVAAGIIDGLKGAESQVADDEIGKVLQQFEMERLKAVAAKNKKEGEAFLTGNKERPGVKATKSGLQYEVLKQGKGQKPKKTDIVTAKVVGMLIDGTEFQKTDQPIRFEVGRVLPGWAEALQLMPVGSKWRLYLPSELAYGENTLPPLIDPNTTVVFELELLEVNEPEDAPDDAEEAPAKKSF